MWVLIAFFTLLGPVLVLVMPANAKVVENNSVQVKGSSIQASKADVQKNEAKGLVEEKVSSEDQSGVGGIEILQMNGKSLRLSHFSDRPLLLVFWATWCDSCLREFEILNRLSRTYAKKLHIVGVSVDSDEKVLKEFLKRTKVGFSILRSTKPLEHLEKVGGGEGVPFTVLYDKDLFFVASFSGSKDEAQLKALLRPLLGE